jgi:acetyl/propionyl-CoA carboxylase alpha subunit
MEKALAETAVLGVTTNIPYLLAILAEPHFQAGQTSTGYIQQHMADWRPDGALSDEDWLALAAVEFLAGGGRNGSGGTAVAGEFVQPDPWSEIGPWRNVAC